MYKNKLKILLSLMVLSIVLLPFQLNLFADTEQTYDAIYFASHFCESCQRVADEGLIEDLVDEGYHIAIYYLEDNPAYTDWLYDYQYTYDVDFFGTKLTPIIFVGETYYTGYTDIKNAIDSHAMQDIMDSTQLLVLKQAPDAEFSLIGFVLLGFVDGVNPCAIAMLLLFISMLSFSDQSKTLLKVSFIFILAIFVSYFLFGTLLYESLSALTGLAPILEIVPWVIVGISSVVLVLNLFDFIVTLRKKYGKVKNQLPSKIQKFNKKMMRKFTEKLESGSIFIYGIAFFIGVVISFTEFLCTGQAYLTAILHLIHFSAFQSRGYLLLLMYNLIFVLPLIIIAVIAVKSKSIMGVSSFMRKNLHWIKLFNVLVFLAIILYYVLVVL